MEPIRASLVYYDIPDNIRFANPSRQLRQIGVRVNLSVWVVPNHLLPWTLFADMDRAGVSRNAIEFSDKEAENLVTIAREALRKQAVQAVNSAQGKADRAIAEADESDDPDSAGMVAARKTRAAARQAERLLGDLVKAAEGFGLSGEDLRVESCFSQVRIIQTISAARARIFVNACAVAKGTGADGHGLATAAEQGQPVPVGYIADVLRDAGKDEEADELTEAFADVS